jgi:methyltransferase family protein
MIDPWKHLTDWNKPANHPDAELESFYQETLTKTEFAAGKRQILRGKSVDVIDQVPDQTLDFAYIDGDHTLRGITIDLICVYPKVKLGASSAETTSPGRSGSTRLHLNRL